MNAQDAIKRATNLMKEIDAALGGNDLTTYEIVTWTGLEDGVETTTRHPLVGLRVAEVGSWTPTAPGATTGGGGTFMQMDVPNGAAVCRRVEELLLCYIEEWRNEPKADFYPTHESEWSAIYAMFGKEGGDKYAELHPSPSG